MRLLDQSPVSVSPQGERSTQKLSGIATKDFRASMLIGLPLSLRGLSNTSHSPSEESHSEGFHVLRGRDRLLVSELTVASNILAWREDSIGSDQGIPSLTYSRGLTSRGLVGYSGSSFSMTLDLQDHDLLFNMIHTVCMYH